VLHASFMDQRTKAAGRSRPIVTIFPYVACL
jgi:hypothetical protein